MSEEIAEPKLTPKQKIFVDAYLGEAHFNATEAARMAGYKGKDASLSQIGYENLRKLEIAKVVEAGLKDRTMSANEVLTRLTGIATGKIDDLLDDAGSFNLAVAKQRGKTHLIKKLKTKRTIKAKKTEVNDDMRKFLAADEIDDIESDVEILFEEVEFEMYSAHEALRDLGKFHKLFTDKTEVTGKDGADLIKQFTIEIVDDRNSKNQSSDE